MKLGELSVGAIFRLREGGTRYAIMTQVLMTNPSQVRVQDEFGGVTIISADTEVIEEGLIHKVRLSELKYGDHFALLYGSNIIYQVISGPKFTKGVLVKDQSGAVGKLSGTRYVYKEVRQ